MTNQPLSAQPSPEHFVLAIPHPACKDKLTEGSKHTSPMHNCFEKPSIQKNIYTNGSFATSPQNTQKMCCLTIIICQVEQDPDDGPHTVLHGFAHMVSYILVRQRLIVW